MRGKKTKDMTREELIEKVESVVRALKRKHDQLIELATDLPPNKAANERHQKHKLAWGRTKTALVGLLDRSVPYVPDDLFREIKYALDHLEYLYQRRSRRERDRDKLRRKKNANAIQGEGSTDYSQSLLAGECDRDHRLGR